MSQGLIELICSRSRPLQPLPTGVAARVERPAVPVKAVLFDVYGTLLVSSSGDISLAARQDVESEMRGALERSGLGLKSDARCHQEEFLAVIRRERERMQRDGVDHPEVDIREIWSGFLDEQRRRGLLAGALDAAGIEALAIDYECAVNPVWPMPGAVDSIRHLRDSGMQLGIVSNAQFFSPLLFDALLGESVADLGFRDDLSSWSYRLRRGKPDPGLYAGPVEQLRGEGIEPAEILMVGNDMRNDIHAADRCGLSTALFAGDRRSLRLRESDEACRVVNPTVVITSLAQLCEIVP